MHQARLEPLFSAGERQQTHTLTEKAPRPAFLDITAGYKHRHVI